MATIIATPIPSFAVGTENAPEGIAQVHEGEMILPPNGGKAKYVPKDMMMHLHKGTVVKTKTDTQSIINDYFGLTMPMLNMQRQDNNADLLEEMQESREVLKAIRDKRTPANAGKPAWWTNYYNQARH